MKPQWLLAYDLGVTGLVACVCCMLFGLDTWKPILAAWLACLVTLFLCVLTGKR